MKKLKFRSKIILIGGHSLGVTIPMAYFNNGLLDAKGEYDFTVEEEENVDEKTDASQN